MLPTKLAFVDIETTGGRTSWDRILEIGIVLVENDTVIDTYSTLINPSGHIPPAITNLTGISSKDVENAPTFREVAGDIITKLKDYTFVAHNVRFDYGFIKAEFGRLGANFTSKHFCTVRLSRALYPTAPKHNLDSIIERFDLTCENRHRALDDALAICTFYHKAKKQIDPIVFSEAMKLVLKKPYLPIQLDEATLDNLPECPGVYIFYAENGSPLYIGKSINIKERVLSHFGGDIHSPLEMKIAQQVKSIETIQTAGELGALFLESRLVKEMLPLYNKMLRRKKDLLALKQVADSDGYYHAELDQFSSPTPSELNDLLGFFRSKKQATDFLAALTKEHLLCEKLLGLEKTSTSCFGYRLDRCKGACMRKEQPLHYNLRFMTAFAKTKVKRWPYGGAIIIEERNEITDKMEYFVIDQWCYMGSVTMDSMGSYKESDQDYTFDLDTYKILVRFLNSPKNGRKIHMARSMQRRISYA
ncbi:exonuclease domain-containing protein [soil metagenome]